MSTKLDNPPADHDSADSTSTTLNDYHAQYEKLCKEFLWQKQMIVPLLQGALPEFRKLSSEEVLACLISDPIIDKIPVHHKDLLSGKRTLDTEIFSIFFEAKSPNPSLEPNNYLLDIEVQNTFDADDYIYEVNRSMVYTYTLLRNQEPKSGVLDDAFFEMLKPTRTIWIYLNSPVERRNFTSIFETKEEKS